MDIEKRIMEILSDGSADDITICCIMYADDVLKNTQKVNNIKRADEFTYKVMRKLERMVNSGVIEYHLASYKLK